MDETPEEMEQIRKEAAAIDPLRYRRRHRLLVTVLASLFCAAVVLVAIHMARASRNPCERVRTYFCSKAHDEPKCVIYDEIFKESVSDDSSQMRSMIRDQCLTKIERMKSEEGIIVE